jgi:hypothetical protein
MGQASVYNPPHCLNFDHGPAPKRKRHSHFPSTTSALVPEVHVTIQNIAPEPTEASLSTDPPSTALLPTVEPSSQGPNSESLEEIVTPSLFPPVSDVIKLAEEEKPGKGFRQIMDDLLDAGLLSSDHILLLEEGALAAIGYMGLPHARALRNFAKRLVLPVLGLRGNYLQPELGELPNVRPTDVKFKLESSTSTSIKREDSGYSDFLRNYTNDSDIIEIRDDSSDFYADE